MSIPDEFDNLSDDIDYAAIGEDEWNLYQTQSAGVCPIPIPISGPSSLNTNATIPTRPASSSSRSTSYFDTDDDENPEFFAQLDALERGLTQRDPDLHTGKRSRSSSDASQRSMGVKKKLKETVKGKEKETEKEGNDNFLTMKGLLDTFEEEVCCPICCEYMAYAHAINPCGHTLCGSCGVAWFITSVSPFSFLSLPSPPSLSHLLLPTIPILSYLTRGPRQKKPTCPLCRTKAEDARPLIPNIVVDNVVRRYMQMLGDGEGGEGGEGEWKVKMEDFEAREREWKTKKEPLYKNELVRRHARTSTNTNPNTTNTNQGRGRYPITERLEDQIRAAIREDIAAAMRQRERESDEGRIVALASIL
ncbi:hypothetical protein PQX77_016251 [Marasmius sp. AFHP31]|nr:hypothetical protein PQX77_016251 [Marasmius sp. AFHP31]